MAEPVDHPQRLRARRDRNYKLVARPTRWGNPFKLSDYSREESMRRYRGWLTEQLERDPQFLEPLRGYHLGCTCAPELACHVDILLEALYPERAR